MRDSGYDSDHFTVAVSLPVSLALRSHSFNVFLAEKVEEFDDDEVVPIKQVRNSCKEHLFFSSFLKYV